MRHLLASAIVVFGLVLLSSCGEQAPTTEINWASSLEDAFQLASEKDQSIIAEFWSDG
jgi:hypothetical protein